MKKAVVTAYTGPGKKGGKRDYEGRKGPTGKVDWWE